MNCPKCAGDQLRCNDSRYKDGTVYRRRTCLSCGHKFTTFEIPLEEYDAMKAKLQKLYAIKEIINK